jgi:hypothetical protein
MLELHRILKKKGKLVIIVPLYNDSVCHTKAYFPKGFFNPYLKSESQNDLYRSKLFEKLDVETISKNFFTKISQKFNFLETLFPRMLYGERIFKFEK